MMNLRVEVAIVLTVFLGVPVGCLFGQDRNTELLDDLKVISETLKKGDTAQVIRAIRRAREYGPGAVSLVPDLVHLIIRSGDSLVTLEIWETMKSIGPKSVPYLIRGIRAGDLGAKLAILELLGRMGEEGLDAGPFLASLAEKDEDVRIRHAAMGALHGSRDRRAIPALLRIANSMDEDLALGALLSLANYGRKASVATQGLIRLLDRPFPLYQVAEAALRYTVDRSHLHYLVETVLNRNTPEDISERIIRLLPKIEDLETDTYEILFKCLNDTRRSIRSAAARALGDFQDVPSKAIAKLTPYTLDEDWDVRLEIAVSIQQLDQKHPVPVLVLLAASKNPDPIVRRLGIKQLGRLKQDDKRILDAFIEALQDRDVAVRKESLLAIWRRGAKGVRAIPHVQPLCQDSNEEIKIIAAEALKKLKKYHPWW